MQTVAEKLTRYSVPYTLMAATITVTAYGGLDPYETTSCELPSSGHPRHVVSSHLSPSASVLSYEEINDFDQLRVLASVTKDLLSNSFNVPPDFAAVIHEEFWNLL